MKNLNLTLLCISLRNFKGQNKKNVIKTGEWYKWKTKE